MKSEQNSKLVFTESNILDNEKPVTLTVTDKVYDHINGQSRNISLSFTNPTEKYILNEQEARALHAWLGTLI